MTGKALAAEAARPKSPAGQPASATLRDVRTWAGGRERRPATAHDFARVPSLAPPASTPRLTIGRPDDAFEAEADRVADLAVAGGATVAGKRSLAAAPANLVQAKSAPGETPVAGPDLPRQIACASSEAQPLPAPQRQDYGQRLGHDFSAVRIHAGPLSAAAAASVGAQAFTHGRNVYFGAGYHRPDTHTGQHLMAHELAHTLQQRPGVIARRALGNGAEAADTSTSARQTAAELNSGEALGDKPGKPAAMEAQPNPSATERPPEKHVSALKAAEEKMQSAVRAATVGEAPVNDPAKEPEDTATPATGSADAGAPRGPAVAAAQNAAASLSEQIALLAEVRAFPVRFQNESSPLAPDPKADMRRQQSESLASAFVGNTAKGVETLLAAAKNVQPQMLASLGSSKSAVAASVATHSATVRASAETARRQVRARTGGTHALINAKSSDADKAALEATGKAKERAGKAQAKAGQGIDKDAKKQTGAISDSYWDAEAPMVQVGYATAAKAAQKAQRKSDAWLNQRNGESTLLDGPLHDDRLEASAEAAINVGKEYGKSFVATANEQADKLPESKPEVVAKVTEISGQAKTGLDAQLKQMNDGADAFGKSAKTQSAKVGASLKSAIGSSATQTLASFDAAEQQHSAGLQAQAKTQQDAMEQATAGALDAMGNGVAKAAGGMTQSIESFIVSASSMPPPEQDELAPALDDAGAQANSAVAEMGVQIATMGPTMAETHETIFSQVDQALKAGAIAAGQGTVQTSAGFGHTAGGMAQQATKGFKALQSGNDKTGKQIGDDAEAGFAEAEKNASAAFGLFGVKVKENFAAGRAELGRGLWSDKTQQDMNRDMHDYGDKAAAEVKPRWKTYLKVLITIVIIVAVIAITVASAGALGPVGVILLGAALGAAAGAVQTIADNMLDGKKWSDGVVKAMIVGAIGGAVGGAGGVLLKGVGSVALRIGLEAGVNVIGGVAGEAIGSLAVGETINWTGALMGALIGAGIGAGLGIAGALKGKIRVGPIGEPAVAAPVRPHVEVPPPPRGRIGAALENAKILAPRSPVAVPEVNLPTPLAEPAPHPSPEIAAPKPAPPVETRAPAPETVTGTKPSAVEPPAAAQHAPEIPVAKAAPAVEAATPSPETLPEQKPALPEAPSAEKMPDNLRSLDAQRAKVRAREAAKVETPEPPEPQAHEEAIPVAAGAEGYTPKPLDTKAPSKLQLLQGGGEQAGGRANLEILNSGKSGGGNNGSRPDAPSRGRSLDVRENAGPAPGKRSTSRKPPSAPEEPISRDAQRRAEISEEFREMQDRFGGEHEKIPEASDPHSSNLDEPGRFPEMDSGHDPYWQPEGPHRFPAANKGSWVSGSPGDGNWQPHDPGAYGLERGQSVPFREGVPDFSAYAVETPSGRPGLVEVEGLNGNGQRDYAATVRQLAEQEGRTPRQIQQWLTENNLRLHHYSGNEMQIVTERLHGALGHQGSATELR